MRLSQGLSFKRIQFRCKYFFIPSYFSVCTPDVVPIERDEISGSENKISVKDKKREYNREYNLKNNKKIKEHKREYNLKNKVKIQEHKREYYSKNKEERKEFGREYRLKNKEKIIEHSREYYSTNKEEKKEYSREKYVQKKKDSDPSFVLKKATYCWKNRNSVRSFFEVAAKIYRIVDFSDWYRVSYGQIKMAGGGGLFRRYGNIGLALKFAYPEYPWQLYKFELRSKKSAQRWLLIKISNLLPKGTVIIEDYRSEELTWGDIRKSVQFDVWIPSLSLVLEYQGEYHSVDLPGSGYDSVDDVRTRDTVKKELCENNGLIYVAVPYWWDGKKDSLSSTLRQYIPEVFLKTDSPPIPSTLPSDYKRTTKTGKEKPKLRVFKCLMQGRDYKEDDPKIENPKGWFMTEKYDGIRGYWDGKQFWSKRGNIINVPESFKSGLPRYHLDGEFWGGYEENAEMTQLLRLSCGKMKSEIESGFCFSPKSSLPSKKMK